MNWTKERLLIERNTISLLGSSIKNVHTLGRDADSNDTDKSGEREGVHSCKLAPFSESWSYVRRGHLQVIY